RVLRPVLPVLAASAPHRHPRSLPTRRSSDLAAPSANADPRTTPVSPSAEMQDEIGPVDVNLHLDAAGARARAPAPHPAQMRAETTGVRPRAASTASGIPAAARKFPTMR